MAKTCIISTFFRLNGHNFEYRPNTRNLSLVPGGYSPKIPIRVCAAQQGRDFGAPDLERGIHFSKNEICKGPQTIMAANI